MNLMLDLTKPVQIRDGMPVRIYATDGAGDFPIHGAFQENGHWFPEKWTVDGYCRITNGGVTESGNDLVNVPVKHTVWLNIYDEVAVPHKELWEAEADGNSRRLKARIKVTYTEGEGL